MKYTEDDMKCDHCGKMVPETTTGSCIGFRLHDSDVQTRLQISKSKNQLRRICSYEGSNWFCKDCLDAHSFCKTCQEETTLDERRLTHDDL